jgi:hypothetical protein
MKLTTAITIVCAVLLITQILYRLTDHPTAGWGGAGGGHAHSAARGY